MRKNVVRISHLYEDDLLGQFELALTFEIDGNSAALVSVECPERGELDLDTFERRTESVVLSWLEGQAVCRWEQIRSQQRLLEADLARDAEADEEAGAGA